MLTKQSAERLQREYEQFLNSVNSQLIPRVGLRHHQCNYDWYEAFDKGWTVRASVNDFLKDKDI